MARKAPSYKGRRPASERASVAARGASRKTDTACEVVLRRALWRAGCRFRKNVRELPGIPDVVFSKARVAVFCDGDFWHGRSWQKRKAKLEDGANAAYWVAKIERNMERDRQHAIVLEAAGWTVLRVWEGDVHGDLESIVDRLVGVLDARGHRNRPRLDNQRRMA